jgi:type VI secretion system protein ImpK
VTNDDPFSFPGDADRTVIRPVPGGKRPTGKTAAPQPRPLPTSVPPVSWDAGRLSGAGANALVQCAAPILALAGQLRNTVSHPDPVGLRKRLGDEVRRFEANARASGVADSNVLPARYVLCAMIDEVVLGTPWGSESVWSAQGLLIEFHNETWGGEKFYLLLDRLLASPSENLDLLELLYFCLALGFQGRYQVREGGQEQRNEVMERLYQVIRNQRGDPEPELSIHWRGVTEQRDPLIHFVPLWVLSALISVLLLGLFAGFSFSLNRDSDPVFMAIRGIDSGLPTFAEQVREPLEEKIKPEPVAVVEEPVAAPTPPPLTLRILLAEEIAADKLQVEDRDDGETIMIRGDGLFRSGKASIREDYEPTLARIGQALDQLPGLVIVTGHTDSVPIHTLRFPSNWHLSQERADHVVAKLSAITGDPDRYAAKGMGDTEPRVPENPKDARNRRVEVTLTPP